MRVFHGSYMAIDRIDLSKCQANKDFGHRKFNDRTAH